MYKKIVIVGSLFALLNLSGCSNTIDGLNTDPETAATAEMWTSVKGRVYANVFRVNGHVPPLRVSPEVLLPSNIPLNFKFNCVGMYKGKDIWENTRIMQKTLEQNACYKLEAQGKYKRTYNTKYLTTNTQSGLQEVINHKVTLDDYRSYCSSLEYEKVDCSE
jgi:hypothetical protein